MCMCVHKHTHMDIHTFQVFKQGLPPPRKFRRFDVGVGGGKSNQKFDFKMLLWYMIVVLIF